MSAVNSSNRKPERPANAVLFWRATSQLKNGGRWAKKIKGKLYHFGQGSYEEALARYEQEKDDLQRGEVQSSEPEALTVESLVGQFLTFKMERCDSGELSPTTYEGYEKTCRMLCQQFGKRTPVADLKPADFARLRSWMARKWGPVRLCGQITVTRMVFKYALDFDLVPKRVNLGPAFKKPDKKTLRLHRQKQGKKMFERDELRTLLAKATEPMRTMILLGVNCGLGNSDCGHLTMSHLDLKSGWLNYPRPKTGVERRSKLWPETIEALDNWLSVRPEPKAGHERVVFLTTTGNSWLYADNPISRRFGDLMKQCGLNGHRNFYALRHTTETIGGACRDQVATDHVMGHSRNDMASIYRERIDDKRLEAVASTIREWLFAEPVEPKLLPMPKMEAV
jgi:integrase